MNTEQQIDPNQEAFQRFEAMRRDWMATQEERDKWRGSAEEREVRIHELERERAGCSTEARIKELEWKGAQLQDALDRAVNRISELKRSCDKAGLEMRRMQNEIERYEQRLSGKSDAPDPGEGFRLLEKGERMDTADYWDAEQSGWFATQFTGILDTGMSFYRVPIENPEPAKEPDELREFIIGQEANQNFRTVAMLEIIARRFERIERSSIT